MERTRTLLAVVAAGSLARVLAWTAFGPEVLAQHGSDICQNQGLPKSSAVINVGAATTAKIVDAVAGKTIFVCGFSGSLVGTTPTVVFKSGTHGTNDCDTGAVALSGAIAPSSGSLVTSGFGQPPTLMTAAAGTQLCATTTGTGSSFQGVLTFVQR